MTLHYQGVRLSALDSHPKVKTERYVLHDVILVTRYWVWARLKRNHDDMFWRLETVGCRAGYLAKNDPRSYGPGLSICPTRQRPPGGPPKDQRMFMDRRQSACGSQPVGQLWRGGHEDLPPPPEVTSHPNTAPSNMAVTGLPVMPQVVPAQRET